MYTNNNFLKKPGWTRLAVNKSVNRPSKASQFYHVTIFLQSTLQASSCFVLGEQTVNKIRLEMRQNLDILVNWELEF